MTEEKLLHLADITTDQLRTIAYLELGRRYSGTNKTGVKSKPDKRKTKKYLNNCIFSAKRGCDDRFIAMARDLLKSIR